MPFILLAFLITLRRFNTLGGHLKGNRKSRHDFMFPQGNAQLFIYKDINQDLWNSCPADTMAFYFQRTYRMTIKECHDILSVMHTKVQ